MSTPQFSAPNSIECIPPRDNFRSPTNPTYESRFNTGKLPKINFPKFEGENSKLGKSRCENYFKMYDVDCSIWVKVATMHFEGPATRWLQSVEHQVRRAS
jgi:hypothetical protein